VTGHARTSGRPSARTALSVIRGGYGALQLARPTLVSSRLLRVPLDARGQALTRLLGARQLAQAAASILTPSYPVLAIGVEVDLLHAASMLAFALAGRRRQATYTDALIAGAFALAGVLAAREAAHEPAPQPGHAVQELQQKLADRIAAVCIPGYPGHKPAPLARHGR
jgi:hypothetical protein